MSSESPDEQNSSGLNTEQNPPAPPISDPDGSVKERLLSKAVCNLDTGCWDWQAGKVGQGYGSFWYNGRNHHAHRIQFRLVYGGIPGGHVVRHTCDNRACVNPDHLVLGTPLDNVRDAINRGHHVKGTIRHDGFTEEEIREIRDRAENDDVTQRELAREFDTTDPTISRIVRRVTYDYID